MNKKILSWFVGSGSIPIPKQVSGLQVWFDISDSNTVTKDGSNRISQILDKSGKSNHVSNAGANTTWPVWTASTINGLPVAKATGASSQILTGPRVSALQGIQGMTIFMVGGKGGYIGHVFSGTVRTQLAQNQTADNRTYTMINNGDSSFGNYSDGIQTYIKTTSIFDGTQSTNATRLIERKNGVAQTLTFSGTVGATTENNAGSVIALCSSPIGFIDSQVGETMIYNRVLTAGEITTIENYLLAKWGL